MADNSWKTLTTRVKKPRYAFKKKRKLAKSTVTAVKNIVKNEIKKEVEYKQYAAATTGVVPAYTGIAGANFFNLTAIPQGPSDSTRNGDEVTLKHIHLRLFFINNTGLNSNPYVIWRVIVFQYKASDLVTAPTITNILLSSAANGGNSGALSSRNIDYLSIYNVLYDRMFQTVAGLPSSTNNGSVANYTSLVKISVPMKYVKRKIQYIAGSTNAVNNIYLLVTTAQGPVTNNPQFIGDWDTTYTDQ